MLVPGDFDWIWHWRTRPTGQNRKGQRCRVLAWGKMNTILVEFPDGYQVTTSRYAVRRRKGARGALKKTA